MTDAEKLNQLHFLVDKALETIDNEKQGLYNDNQDYISERNELEKKLVKIYEMFFKGETYIFHAISRTQYDNLIKKLESLKG